uniref:Sequence-specific DNA binding transcription factor n=1 Tax=Ascaris lumbricoides TaxID=6252 RepID=A0A0M3IAW8_ASCLU
LSDYDGYAFCRCQYCRIFQGKILSDESLNPYKNKREDKPSINTSSPNPYKHKSKWVYAPIDVSVPDVNNYNIQGAVDNFGNATNDWTRDQQAMEMRANQLREWQIQQQQQQQLQQQQQFQQQQQQLQQQQQQQQQMMQLQAQQQALQHLNQQEQMQLQNALMQQQMHQSQFPIGFNPNAQNFPSQNIDFNNNISNNPRFSNNYPNLGKNAPNHPLNHPSFIGNSPNSFNNGPNFGARFTANGPFVRTGGPNFSNSKDFIGPNQMSMPHPGQFPPNMQMQMRFPPNMLNNFNGPPMFMMQNPNPNGLDIINDPMHHMNREFENGVPVRF